MPAILLHHVLETASRGAIGDALLVDECQQTGQVGLFHFARWRHFV